MGSWHLDLRYAWRTLRRRPLATGAIVATLALALAAQVAIFRVFDAVVVRPLPFADSERLVRLYVEPRERTGERLSPGVEVLLALQRETRSFAAVVGQRYMDLTLRLPEGAARVATIGVTAGWGELLGVEPLLGRSFHRDEERQGMGSGVALVSHGTWQGLLGGDPHILGRHLRLGDRTFTVVGVMPPGFAFPYEAQVWVPLRPEVDAVGPWGFFIPARLAPGVGLASANRELAALAARRPDLDGRVLTAVPLREVLLGRGRGTALVLLGAVGFLLLLVCANLANLFLVRTLGRRRELAVRTALGATRGRLARQLFAESLLVSLLAAGLASLVAAAAAPLMRGLLPDDLHRLGGVPVLDGRLLAFTVLVAVACAVGCGLLPGLRARRTNGLAHAGRSEPRSGRMRGFLVGAEIALALVLVAGALLLTRDLVRRQGLDLGYDPEDLLTFEVSLAEEPSADARAATLGRLATAVAAVPGVQESGATCIYPSRRGNYVASTLVEGEPEDTPQLVNHRLVSAGFLSTLRVPLLAGRRLTAADDADGQPVAMVSASLAQRRWPGERAVGKRIREAAAGQEARWLTVVGVVGDVAEFWEVEDTWYLPLAQHLESPRATDLVFVLRSPLPGGALEPALRAAVQAAAPDVALSDLATPRELYRETLAAQRSTGLLASLFGALALLVAMVGVYAAMAAWAAERRREMAVRVAVGASPGRALRELASPGLRLVGLGLAAGVASVVALLRVLPRLVPGVEAGAGLPIVMAALLLGLAAVVACLVPGRHLAYGDSVRLLRED